MPDSHNLPVSIHVNTPNGICSPNASWEWTFFLDSYRAVYPGQHVGWPSIQLPLLSPSSILCQQGLALVGFSSKTSSLYTSHVVALSACFVKQSLRGGSWWPLISLFMAQKRWYLSSLSLVVSASWAYSRHFGAFRRQVSFLTQLSSGVFLSQVRSFCRQAPVACLQTCLQCQILCMCVTCRWAPYKHLFQQWQQPSKFLGQSLFKFVLVPHLWNDRASILSQNAKEMISVSSE